MSEIFRIIFHSLKEFPAANCCLLAGKHCWLSSRRKQLPPSPLSTYKVVVTNAYTKAADWSPHSQHTAQKVCVSNSPVSKMPMPGREEPAFCSLSAERSFVCSSSSSQSSPQLQRALWILTLGSMGLEVRKKALQCSLPQCLLHLTRLILNFYVMQENERKHNTDSEEDLEVTFIAEQLQEGHTKKSHYTFLYAGANLE